MTLDITKRAIFALDAIFRLDRIVWLFLQVQKIALDRGQVFSVDVVKCILSDHLLGFELHHLFDGGADEQDRAMSIEKSDHVGPILDECSIFPFASLNLLFDLDSRSDVSCKTTDRVASPLRIHKRELRGKKMAW